jgi:hypothetical protein
MNYKLLHKTTNDIQILALIDDDGVCRLTCTEEDQAYLKWLEEGNQPLPADES